MRICALQCDWKWNMPKLKSGACIFRCYYLFTTLRKLLECGDFLYVFFWFLCDDNMVKLFAVSCKCEFIQDEILSIEFIEIIMSFWCIRLQINVGMWVCVNINITNYLPINHIVYYRRIADMMSECIAIELIEWPNKQGQTITDNTN